MKKLFTVSALVLLCLMTSAQKGFNLEWIVAPGISMGADYVAPVYYASGPTDAQYLEKDITIGFNLGTGFSYFFTDKNGISLHILYSKQGQKYKEYIIPYSNTEKFNDEVTLNYIKIPIQFQYLHNAEKKISFAFSAGVYGAFLVDYEDHFSHFDESGQGLTGKASGDKLKVSLLLAAPYSSLGGDITYQFNEKPFTTTDFGISCGVGMQVKLSEQMMLPVMVNFQRGLTNIKNLNSYFIAPGASGYSSHVSYWQDTFSDNPGAYNNSLISLLVGLKINLSK
jgi:hypothetical protein